MNVDYNLRIITITFIIAIMQLCIAFKRTDYVFRYCHPKPSRFLLSSTKSKGSSTGSKSVGIIIEEREIGNPKKLAEIETLDTFKADLKMKTGAQLRQQQRQALKVQRVKAAEKYARKKAQTKQGQLQMEAQSKIRFTLGCGIEVLTSAALIGLVKSTAGYYFPEVAVRAVLDEDDYDEDYNDDTSDVHITGAGVADDTGHESSATPQITLAQSSNGKNGWLSILRSSNLPPATDAPTKQQRVDYFALCLAAHFATVATYVPTDVDSKIRGHCWSDSDEEVLVEQFQVLKNALAWDVSAVSRRVVWMPQQGKVPVKGAINGPISGHDGEWLGVLVGAFGAFLRIGNTELAAEAENLIEQELEREANAFRECRLMKPSFESDTRLLKLAAILTHNVGDVDQGYSYWPESLHDRPEFTKYAKLAHAHFERFGGEYFRAKTIYKDLLSAEGHRNYPLREAKCLRSTPDLMLPLGPWLESWGKTIAKHPALSEDDIITITRQLVRGCDTKSKSWCVPNQIGYYRAISGIAGNVRNFDKLMKSLDKDCRTFLAQDHEMRLHLGITEEAFAAKLGHRARDMLKLMP